jgi:hypothetical protein
MIHYTPVCARVHESYVGKSISKLQMDIKLKQQEYWLEKYFYFST